jgi:hypothetical protein
MTCLHASNPLSLNPAVVLVSDLPITAGTALAVVDMTPALWLQAFARVEGGDPRWLAEGVLTGGRCDFAIGMGK